MKSEIQRFIKYCLVGLSNAIIDFSVLNILLYFQTNPYLATSISFVCAATNSYFLHRNWTFRDRKSQKTFQQYILFIVMATSGLALNNLLVLIFQHYIHIGNLIISTNIAKIIAIIILVGWNYSLSRLVIFRPVNNQG